MSALHKQKRKQLTVGQKKDIIQKVHDGISRSVICKEYGLATSTVSTILKNEEKIIESFTANPRRKRQRNTDKPDLDEALLNWFRAQSSAEIHINGPVLKHKATQFGVALGYGANFDCSISWINRFKKRHNINSEQITEDEEPVEVTVTENWLTTSWPQLKRSYTDADIFNADETALFYKLTPDQTPQCVGELCCGGQLRAQRVTMLVCTNADGSEKRKLLVVGKGHSPGFEQSKSLPVKYRSSQNAWITPELFSEELYDWDSELIKKKRKILLVVDKCEAHPKITDLKNIKLVVLPVIASLIQPMKMGIINCLKFYYRKGIVLHFIDSIETGNPDDITLLDAVRLLERAWKNLTQTTIKNCFRHAGFIQETIKKENWQWENEVPLRELCASLNAESLDFQHYVMVDNHVWTSDDNTVDNVGDQDTCQKHNGRGCEAQDPLDDALNQLPEKITRFEARNCLAKLRSFFENSSMKNVEQPFGLLTNLENFIDDTSLTNVKQMKVSNYFEC